MKLLFAGMRCVLSALALAVLVAGTCPAAAQQPSSVSPSADAITEEQLLQQLQRIQGRGSIPDVKSYVLEQPLGRQWRAFHEVALPWLGGVTILGIIGILAIFYLVRGPLRIEGGRSGRKLLRFNSFERFAHWLVGVSFVVLALTGLNITFGKRLLLPLIGPDAFTNVAALAKYVHDFSSVPFMLGIVLLFVLWINENFPTAADIVWLKEGGGFVGHKHPPAWKFNAGQKMLFWFIIGASVAVAVSGYILMFPFYITDIFGMQVAQVVHAVIAMFFIMFIIAHIYIGTLGMEGGFDAMTDGEVDLNWAKQHHSLWVEQELARGRDVGRPAKGPVAAE